MVPSGAPMRPMTMFTTAASSMPPPPSVPATTYAPQPTFASPAPMPMDMVLPPPTTAPTALASPPPPPPPPPVAPDQLVPVMVSNGTIVHLPLHVVQGLAAAAAAGGPAGAPTPVVVMMPPPNTAPAPVPQQQQQQQRTRAVVIPAGESPPLGMSPPGGSMLGAVSNGIDLAEYVRIE
ncbi:hypothetical protein AMAG_15477, partial [Allomyces macrogynus ATCC 38327]